MLQHTTDINGKNVSGVCSSDHPSVCSGDHQWPGYSSYGTAVNARPIDTPTGSKHSLKKRSLSTCFSASLRSIKSTLKSGAFRNRQKYRTTIKKRTTPAMKSVAEKNRYNARLSEMTAHVSAKLQNQQRTKIGITRKSTRGESSCSLLTPCPCTSSTCFSTASLTITHTKRS